MHRTHTHTQTSTILFIIFEPNYCTQFQRWIQLLDPRAWLPAAPIGIGFHSHTALFVWFNSICYCFERFFCRTSIVVQKLHSQRNTVHSCALSDAINNAILPLAAYKLSGWKTLKFDSACTEIENIAIFPPQFVVLVAMVVSPWLRVQPMDSIVFAFFVCLIEKLHLLCLWMDCVDTIFGEIRAQCLCVPCWTCALASHYSSLYISACQNLLCFRHHAFGFESPSEIVRQFR